MQQGPQRSHVLTGFAAMLAVFAGFVGAIVTNKVPQSWRPFAWVAIAVGVIIQLLIASQRVRGTSSNVLYALLGFPIGVAVNVLVEDTSSTSTQIQNLLVVGAFLALTLVGAALLHYVRSGSDLKGDAVRIMSWVYTCVGTVVGSMKVMDFLNIHHREIIACQYMNACAPFNAETLIPLVVVPLVLIPGIASFFAAWTDGNSDTGIRVAITVVVLVFVLTGIYLGVTDGNGGPIEGAPIDGGPILTGMCGSFSLALLIGWPVGVVGGNLGAAIRRLGDPSASTY